MSPSAVPLPTTAKLTADAISSELSAPPSKPQLDASLLTSTFSDKLKPVAAQDDPIRWSQNCTTLVLPANYTRCKRFWIEKY